MNKSEGYPGGGNGGQFYQTLPNTTDGHAPPPNLRVVNVRHGNQYVIGTYDATAESFKYEVNGNSTACSCCPFPSTCLVEKKCAGRTRNGLQQNCTGGLSEIRALDVGNQFQWGAFQLTAGRMMNVAWVTSIATQGGKQGAPNSALSLMRELHYSVETKQLVANPMPELELLRTGTSLFHEASMQLQPDKLSTLKLSKSGAGDTIDLTVSFELNAGITSFGLSVLANERDLSGSAVIRVNVSAVVGGFTGTVQGAVELSPPGLEWNGTFLLSNARAATSVCGGAACVDVRVLVDRSIIEIFVAGGQVASLMAFQPPSVNYTNVHLFAAGEEAVTAKAVHVFEMGCGWNESAGYVNVEE